MDLVSFAVWVSLLYLIWFFLQTGVLKLNFLVRSLILSFTCALAEYLLYAFFVCDRVAGVRRLLLRIARFCGSLARQVTLWSYPFITQFLCISSNPQNCMVRMWLTCGLGSSWWGRTYCPVIQTLGVTSTYCLYCYAMLVDVDWVWVSTWQRWDC